MASYATPRKRFHSTDAAVDDAPIQAFCRVIENVPADQWTQRCAAFQKLVAMIPETRDSSSSSKWYGSPKTLRHLTLPLSELLKDARSTVVKRTCESSAQLFAKCRADARYLMKDLMPTIIGVHAQTVQVIRSYVQNMICDALLSVPCKAAMPLWLERLKTDRSRTVREACSLYLRIGLENWRHEDGYLTNDIWLQVGACLIRALRDPSPSVREYIRQGLEIFRTTKPDLWGRLINDPDGPASRDLKVQKYLTRMGDDSTTQDELSVASRSSWVSTASARSSRVPATISGSRRGLGPAVRTPVGSIESSPKFSPSHHSTRTTSPHIASSPRATSESNFTFESANGSAATKRRDRRSFVMQERWRRSSSNLAADDGNGGTKADEAEEVPEHLQIAQQLLDDHRRHLDKVMETLRLEMDAMRDFEKLVNSDDSKVPSDEQVLDYFETVGNCLDERASSGRELQQLMDRLSQEPGNT